MRADKFLAEKFGSRTKAENEIKAGRVLKNGKPIAPSDEIRENDVLTFIEPKERFVSNGGYKLSRAIGAFSFDCHGKIFVDLGASTGGFTDCLLQNGAKKVYAVDVGESLLDPTLQKNDKIVAMENVNARYLTREFFQDTIDAITADVSFISLSYIFPVVKAVLKDGGDAFLLIKPQFECGKNVLGKSGIAPVSVHEKVVKKLLSDCAEIGLVPLEIVNAPIKTGKNVEYILHVKNGKGNDNSERILSTLKALVSDYRKGILE